MRKAYLLLALFVLLAGTLTACGESSAEPTPEEYASELVIEVPEVQPPPAEPQSEEQAVEPPLEEPVQEQPPPEEVTPEEPLPAHLQYIVDAGYFSGERYRPWLWSTYTNTALGIVYHYEGDVMYSFFMGAYAGEAPGELMRARGINDRLGLSVIAGSGEEWVRQQADDFVERYIEHWLETEERFRKYECDEYEELLAQRIQRRDEAAQRRAERYPDRPFEKIIHPLTPDELDLVEFWPVEYEIAGREFVGLQINVMLTSTSHNMGDTHLFHQIDDNTALVITIMCQTSADSAARRHIARFSALP